MRSSLPRRALSLLVPAIALTLAAPAAVRADPAPLAVPVVTARDLGDEAGGRLLVFAQKIESGAEPQEAVDTSPFDPTGTAIAALAVKPLAPGPTAPVGTEVDAFPKNGRATGGRDVCPDVCTSVGAGALKQQ